MNEESKSAVFGLNWLQEAKTGNDEPTPGSYDAEREVWTTTDGQVLAAGSDLRTRYFTSQYSGSYSSSYSAVYFGSGAVGCDANCDALCDALCDVAAG